jgi:hypothetical protein
LCFAYCRELINKKKKKKYIYIYIYIYIYKPPYATNVGARVIVQRFLYILTIDFVFPIPHIFAGLDVITRLILVF